MRQGCAAKGRGAAVRICGTRARRRHCDPLCFGSFAAAPPHPPPLQLLRLGGSVRTPRFCVSLMSGRTDGTALPAPAKMQPPRGCRSATPSNANEHHARVGLKKRSQQEAGWRLQLTLGHIDKCYFCETESSRWCNQGLGRGRLVSECGCKISCCWRCTFNAGMRASILGDALKCPNNCCAVVTEIQELDFAPMASLPQGCNVVVKSK